jgi:hypothetical protein
MKEIHAHIETLSVDGRWHYLDVVDGSLWIDRNWILHGILNGGIGDFPPLVEDDDRGLPDDVSEELWAIYRGWDWPSWVTPEEVERYDWGQPLPEGDYRWTWCAAGCATIGDVCAAFRRTVAEYAELGTVRVVFWFD